ncbi:hypothetical protein ACSSV4_003286 [Roseovarius sp. MBR-154]
MIGKLGQIEAEPRRKTPYTPCAHPQRAKNREPTGNKSAGSTFVISPVKTNARGLTPTRRTRRQQQGSTEWHD